MPRSSGSKSIDDRKPAYFETRLPFQRALVSRANARLRERPGDKACLSVARRFNCPSQIPGHRNACMAHEKTHAPLLIDPLALSQQVQEAYRNVSLGEVNDHEIRMSVMTEQFRWHSHPDSDETFVGVDGELIIEFRDRDVLVGPGQLVTVPAGVSHRTRPVGERSVNLTFERIGAATIFEE